MAKMIDFKPSYKGEAKVWNALSELLPDNIIVYNHREINGREFDFCLFIEDIGVLFIEVKGWITDKISVKGVDNIIVEGYEKPQRSPKKQARAYRFALLNMIREKYNTSPLIFDMVCYPFISKKEYIEEHLNIISEEQFTIFRENLENSDSLINKIQGAYEASKNIPHADFSFDLIIKLRQEWEPDFLDDVQQIRNIVRPYSVLSVYTKDLTSTEIGQIITDYFSGIKRIIFINSKSSYIAILNSFNDKFNKENIQPGINKLEVGYREGFSKEQNSIRAFNLEIYFVNDMPKQISSSIQVEEGNIGDDIDAVIKQLSEITHFNYQQFKVEHASTDHNILVEAGAGTGKTFSMVSRVAFLCNKKTGAILNIANEIAMVTFTNDAANNMKTRIKQMFINYFILTGDPQYIKFIEDTDRAHISTIHSFAFDILREESLYTGVGTNFSVSSNEYLREKIYDKLLGDFLENKEKENSGFVNEVSVPIYDLKRKLISMSDKLLAKSVDLNRIKLSEMGETVDNAIPFFNELIEKVIIPAERQYTDQIHNSDIVDLKECIILLNEVIDKLPGKLDNFKFKYLFVDEFQDTDDVQIQVFQKLQKVFNSNCRMFIVGDLKQSIYRFRGAKLSAFVQMTNASLFKWDTYYLNVNYRTDSRLLDKFHVIFSRIGDHNYLPYEPDIDKLTSNVIKDIDDKDLFLEISYRANNSQQFEEGFLNALNDQIEILHGIMEKKAVDGLPPLSKEERTIAILVRSNWQVYKIVSLAKKKGIKIDTKSGGDLFQLESTHDLYKLLLALSNGTNPVYMVNFLESNYARLKLDYQRYFDMTEAEVVTELTRILDELFMLRMDKTWHQIINEAYTQPILYVMRQIYEALQPWKQFKKGTDREYYRLNYEYLIERIIKQSRVDTLTLNQIVDYLKVCITTKQQQLSREIERNDEDIQLICTTIHKSKGLEYGTVILPYTDEDIGDIKKVKLEASYTDSSLAYTVLFDNKIREHNSNYDESIEIEEQISEEARILYVALTRTIRNCVWFNNIDSESNISWSTFMEE